MLDSQGTPTIQFQSLLLNCLPIDVPCLRKLPTTSVWMITGLDPSSKSPSKLVVIASPKYRDTTIDTPPQSTRFLVPTAGGVDEGRVDGYFCGGRSL